MNDHHGNGMTDTAQGGRPAGEGAKNGQKRPLSARQEAAALSLATGHSMKETAAACGTSGRSLRRWAESGDFIRRVREHRSGLLAEAVGRLASLGGQAANVLGALLADESAPVRLRAAAAVLSALTHGHRIVDANEVTALAEKVLARSAELDAEWQQLQEDRRQLGEERLRLVEDQRRLELERRRLDDDRRRQPGNGAAGAGDPYGYGR